MDISKTPHPQNRWLAALRLNFSAQGDKTILSARRHEGPLVVQKALYPEGPAICHAIVIHPPGGIAGGDTLRLESEQEKETHVVLSTPAATKWYKSNGQGARQETFINLAAGARLDWLPQENILFNAARASISLRIKVAPQASAMGWDSFVLGRLESGETWTKGELRIRTEINDQNDQPQWIENAVLSAGSPLLSAFQGLDGFPVFGTFWSISPRLLSPLEEGFLDRLVFDDHLRASVTCLPPGIVLIRALARKVEILRAAMIRWWCQLRPIVHGVAAKPLRLWST